MSRNQGISSSSTAIATADFIKEDEYLYFLKAMTAGERERDKEGPGGGGPIDRISPVVFKRGLMRYEILNREEDCDLVCLEINPNGGDLPLSTIRAKIASKDPKISSVLKRFIRAVNAGFDAKDRPNIDRRSPYPGLDHHQGSIRDRVLGKIISRAGETMTPELNLLRSPMNAYRYTDQESSLDIKDELIDVVPFRSSTVESAPLTQRSQIAQENPSIPTQPKVSLATQQSSRDKVLGKIISNAVHTVSLEKSTMPPLNVTHPPSGSELTPRPTSTFHSSRDKVLTKIISNAASAAGISSSIHPSTLPSVSPGKAPAPTGSKNKNPNPSIDLRTSGALQVGGQSKPSSVEADCALLDYCDESENLDEKTTLQKEGRTESKRRATFDPEMFHQSSHEYFHVDMMDTQAENKHFLEVSPRDNRRRHSEVSFRDDRQMGSMQLNGTPTRRDSIQFRGNYKDIPQCPSKQGINPPSGVGRVRNKILNRMVNRVKETVLHPTPQTTEDFGSDTNTEDSLKVTTKPQSPKHETNAWFHIYHNNASIAVENPQDTQHPEKKIASAGSSLEVQSVDSVLDGPVHPVTHLSVDPTKNSEDHLPLIHPHNVHNPLRSILSDAAINPSTPTPLKVSTEGGFFPGYRFSGKASPLQLSVSTPQSYRETYRITNQNYNGSNGSPEKDVDHHLVEKREEIPAKWSKGSSGKLLSEEQSKEGTSKWVDAAPVGKR